MDLDEQLKLGHLLLEERTCRVCGERKNLLQSFYRVHKNVKLLSSYSYECVRSALSKELLKVENNHHQLLRVIQIGNLQYSKCVLKYF